MPEGIQQVQGSQKLALGFSVQDTGIEYPAEFQALSKWINDFCLLTLQEVAQELRSGKFEAAVQTLRNERVEMTVDTALRNIQGARSIGTTWAKSIIIGGTQVRLYTYDSMGRYYKKLKKYDNAETYFKKAKIIYEAMLADKIAGKKGTYEEISRNAELGTVLVGDEYLRGTVRFINISDPNTGVTYRNLIRNDDSFSLINDSIPEFMIGYAGLLQSAEILKPEEAITFTEEDLNKTVKGMLKDSSDMLKSAENEYENEFIPKYLRFNKPRAEIMDEIRSKRMRKIELSEKEFIVERIELKLQTSKIRLGLAKANYLFEVAKVIRTKNFDFANKIIGDAIKITGDVLEGNIPNRPPQEIISALLTLAWGYSSKAALLEDEEKNKGIQYATAAAGIYKAILHGFDSLDPEMMKALSDIAKTSIYGKVKNYIENDCDFISRSLKNVMNGGGNIWWHGTLPQIIGPADVDVLAILTNNELELSLTYAGNLSSAGRYEEALIEYDNLLGVEKRLNSKINNSLHETFWARVRSAKANALTRIANEDFITRNYKEAGEKLIEAERLTKESLNSLEGTIKGIKNAIKRPGAILTDVPEEYYTEMVRSADTLGWIYGIRGRIDKELNGTRKKYFEKAKKIYEAIHIYSKTEAAPTDNDPEFNHLLTFISETTSGLSNEKLLDIQFETNFTDSHLRLKRADSYKDLKEYDLAIGTYSEIQKGNILHMKAQVGMQEARIEKVKEELKIDGDKEKALNSLILNSDSVAETLRELHESTSDRMLLHRIISTASWAYSLAGGIEEKFYSLERRDAGKIFFLKAAVLDQELLYGRIPDKIKNKVQNDQTLTKILASIDKNREALLDEDILKEAGRYKADIILTQAENLRAAGERDKEVLEVAEAEYNKAVDECTKFNGELQRRETQYKDSLTEKGKVPSEIINIEAKKNRLSGIKTKTDLTLNLAKLGGIEARIQKIKFQVMETKEEEAHTEIEKILTEFKDSKILENITKAVKDGHTSFIHLLRAVFTFSWMLGSKGGLLEEINGEGEGRDPFFLAALPYVILLYGSDPQKLQGEHPLLSKALGKMNDVASLKDALELIEKNKAIINDELLKEIENSVPNLKYVLAELIKAAGAENEDLLNLAIDLYKEVKSADKAQTENNFGKRETELLMGKAKLGQIEAGLVLAEALREDDTRTPTLYEESISTLKEILKNDVHPDIALKAGLDLTWAYSSRGGFLEDTGEESDPDFMRGAAILIALIHGPDELKKDEDIYLEMLKGDKNLLDLIMNKKFTKAEKTDFYIDEELLFNAQTPKGRLHGRLAGLYGALERFKDGMIEARLSDKKYLSVSILASARYYEEAVKKYKEEIKIRKDKTTPKAIKELNKLTYELADVLFWGREDYKESIKFLNILLSQLKKITEEKGEKNVEEKESEKWIKLLMLKAYLRLGQMYAYWDTPLKYRDSEDFLKRIMRLTLKTYDPVKALENVQKSESLGKGVKDIVAQASSVLESIYGNPDWSGYNLELKKNFHELAKYCAKKKKTRINIENTARKTGEWYRWKVSLGHAQFHDPLGRNEQNTTLRISLRPEKLKSFEFNLTGIYLDANDPLGKVKEEHKALGYLGATYYLGGMDKLLLSVSAEAKIDWAKEYYRYFINSHLIGDLKLNYKNRIQGEFKYGYNKSLQDNVYGSLLLTPMPFFGTQWASGFAAGYEFNHYPSLHDKELITKNTHTLLMGYTGMLKDVYGRAFLGIPLRPGSPISFSAGLGVDVLDLILKLQEDFGKLEESKLKFIQSARLDLGYSLYVLQSDRYYFNTFSMMLTLGFGK